MDELTEQPRKKEIDTPEDQADIAIIDDDPGFSFMLKDYLYTSGQFNAELFSTGEEFLKDYHQKNNCKIILDFDFQNGLNGLGILQKIKDINPSAIVIMVSSQDDLETAIETIRKGAIDYFLKTNKTVFANIYCSLKKIYEMERNRWN